MCAVLCSTARTCSPSLHHDRFFLSSHEDAVILAQSTDYKDYDFFQKEEIRGNPNFKHCYHSPSLPSQHHTAKNCCTCHQRVEEVSTRRSRSRLQLDRQTTPLNSVNLQADPDTSAPSISTVDFASRSGNRRGPLPSQTRRRIQLDPTLFVSSICVVELRSAERPAHRRPLIPNPRTVVLVNARVLYAFDTDGNKR